MTRQLQPFSNRYSWFSAIDGSKLTQQDYYPHIASKLNTSNPIQGVDLTLGAIGCAMSHKKIWEMTVKTDIIGCWY